MSRYKKPVSVYLPPAIHEVLAARAEAEARSLSKMAEILLTGSLAPERQDRPADAREIIARARRAAGVTRKEPCEHRVPPDSHCARCDK